MAKGVSFTLSGVIAALTVDPYSFNEAGTGKLVEGITRICYVVTGFAEPVVEVRFRDADLWGNVNRVAQFDEVTMRVVASNGRVFAESVTAA